MKISNPRVHIICGMCGCNSMMKFRIKKETNDDTNQKEDKVYIICDNCGCLTGLDELIKNDNI